MQNSYLTEAKLILILVVPVWSIVAAYNVDSVHNSGHEDKQREKKIYHEHFVTSLVNENS